MFLIGLESTRVHRNICLKVRTLDDVGGKSGENRLTNVQDFKR